MTESPEAEGPHGWITGDANKARGWVDLLLDQRLNDNRWIIGCQLADNEHRSDEHDDQNQPRFQ